MPAHLTRSLSRQASVQSQKAVWTAEDKAMCNRAEDVLCPSAQVDWQGAELIGIVGGSVSDPRLARLDRPIPVTEELTRLAHPVTPGEVFRVAAPCLNSECGHFHDTQCRLVEKVVRFVPPVSSRLPACAIRPRCRWWQQEGKPACMRCDQIATDNPAASPEMRQAANPECV